MNLDNLTLGVDIESISRFNELDRKKNKSFLDKIYSEKELDYCYSHKNYAQHLAVRFAAKEAIFKAFSSCGLDSPFYNKIEILNNTNITEINGDKFVQEIILEEAFSGVKRELAYKINIICDNNKI